MESYLCKKENAVDIPELNISSKATDILVSEKGDNDPKSELNNRSSKNKAASIPTETEIQSRTSNERQKGNLDLFESMFESWREKEVDLEQDGKGLNQKIDTYIEEQKISNAKIEDLNKTIELLQASITALHNELNMVEQLGKENADLRSKLNTSESHVKALKHEDNQKKSEFSSKLCNIEKEHASKIKIIEEENTRQIDKLTSNLNEIIKQKDKEICELKHNIEQIEKDKQSELVRMSVDYDNKLAKIQRQKAAASLNQQPSSSNQEIFRKKLQHLKTEYDREVSNLKEQVASLQSQLSATESPRQSRSLFAVGPLSKKMRKQ